MLTVHTRKTKEERKRRRDADVSNTTLYQYWLNLTGSIFSLCMISCISCTVRILPFWWMFPTQGAINKWINCSNQRTLSACESPSVKRHRVTQMCDFLVCRLPRDLIDGRRESNANWGDLWRKGASLWRCVCDSLCWWRWVTTYEAAFMHCCLP